jgi:hypothetical protein
MYLYFENSYGQRRLIGEPKTSVESFKIISDFCKERNFEIPYVRTWTNASGEKYYDVSSHTEFFIEVEDELHGDK